MDHEDDLYFIIDVKQRNQRKRSYFYFKDHDENYSTIGSLITSALAQYVVDGIIDFSGSPVVDININMITPGRGLRVMKYKWRPFHSGEKVLNNGVFNYRNFGLRHIRELDRLQDHLDLNPGVRVNDRAAYINAILSEADWEQAMDDFAREFWIQTLDAGEENVEPNYLPLFHL